MASTLGCIAAWGPAVGLVAVFGVMTVGAFANVLTLTYAPAQLVRSGIAASFIGGCAFVFAIAV